MASPPHEAGSAFPVCRDRIGACGSTTALDQIPLDIRAGSVHAPVGEDGAGTATLWKVT